ncbi:DNA-binding domain-containing protein [Rubellicoccus peritrichatus]|uniref:DNA-binding domain-containing protein n=1 Tax=Rubellicoccus peritrichatus TaxID=3080537 RepID=A0AAQ3QVE2_9BACT|nr:DNA-binding domain-containing protein [Puniceicoccus sp. CR14]WOO41508.1 DNA-binding domain-containing protein [Puniceicoccus sp. CR14]
MAIKYALYENQLTADAGDFYARTKPIASKDFDGLVERMMEQGSTITEADVRAVLLEAIRAVKSLLLDGQRININGLVHIWPSIKGRFDGDVDSYDASRHELNLNTTADRGLIDELRTAAVLEKDTVLEASPQLRRYVDNASGSVNATMTPGMIGQITGKLLDFDQVQADEGLFLIDALTDVETKVAYIQKNTATDTVFLVPDTLTADTQYQVELRTRLFGGEELRSGKLKVTLRTPA